MWILLGLILLPIVISVCIRNHSLARIQLHSYLYKIGIQWGNHVYTPVCDICTDFRFPDLVLLGVHHEHLHIYRIFQREHVHIPLVYVQPGYHLEYKGPESIMYMEGTPFRVKKGELVLYKRQRKGMAFMLQEVQRSTQWTM